MSFEENLSELNKIVSELEKGSLPLDKSVELYEKGLKLSQLCQNELSQAKLKITEI